nr:tropomyosin-like protein 6 [Parasacculina yatsui]
MKIDCGENGFKSDGVSSNGMFSDNNDSGVDLTANVNEAENEGEPDGLSKLRCSGESSEIVAQRLKQRKCRSSTYPGLAFATSVFSSGTLMKFSVIKNEVHNIMCVHLRKLEAEISLVNDRIKCLDEKLVQSGHDLISASTSLSQLHRQENTDIEHSYDQTDPDTCRIFVLEEKLLQSKIVADQVGRKHSEVANMLEKLIN